MRLTSLPAFTVTLVLVTPLCAEAQSARSIIDRYLEASGGKKAIERIGSTEVSGRISADDGSVGTFTLLTQRPRLFSVIVSGRTAGWRTAFNGRAAWHAEGSGAPQTLYGEAAARVRADAMFANTRYVASDHLTEFVVRGPEDVRGRPAVALVALAADGQTRTLFFDAESHLLVKDEQPTGAAAEERFFDDYRRVGGVMEPHRIEWHRNGQTLQLVVERVTHNTPLDAELFDIPAPRAEPGMDIDTVLAAARRGEEQAAAARASYAYVQALTGSDRDVQGTVIRTDHQLYDVFHLGGYPFLQLTRKNGEAPGDAERRRQQEQVARAVRQLEQGQPPPAPAPWSASVVFQGPLMVGRFWLPAYLRMSEFSRVRREEMRGRAALVMEFQPRRGARATRGFEEQIGRMSGVMWMDDASQQIVRIESYFSDTFRQLVPGSSSRMELTLVDDQVWLPLRSETQVRRTRGFADPFHIAVVFEFSEYRKFGVSTDSTIALPDAGR